MSTTAVSGPLREHQFWLRVLADHTEFIAAALDPAAHQLVAWADDYRRLLQARLWESLAQPAATPALSRTVRDMAVSLSGFKEFLLQAALSCATALKLPPTLVSHMITEANEAARVMDILALGAPMVPAAELLHQHSVWLPDATGHAAILGAQLDPSELDLRARTGHWERLFGSLSLHARELRAMLRQAPRIVEALNRLDRLTVEHMSVFKDFLAELKTMRAECKVMGFFPPRLPEHMELKSLYYIEKVSQLDPEAALPAV